LLRAVHGHAKLEVNRRTNQTAGLPHSMIELVARLLRLQANEGCGRQECMRRGQLTWIESVAIALIVWLATLLGTLRRTSKRGI